MIIYIILIIAVSCLLTLLKFFHDHHHMVNKRKDVVPHRQDLSSTLACPICKERSSIYYQCRTGHSVCHLCRSRLEKNKCPFCDEEVGSTRNFALENIVQGLPQAGQEQARCTVAPRLAGVPAGQIKIFVKTLTGKTFVLTISPSSSVMDFKQKLAVQQAIPAQSQRLIFLGKEMKNTDSLTDYQVKDGSTLQLVMRLLGGGHGQGLPLDP